MKLKTLFYVASLSCSTVLAGEVNVIVNSDFEKVDADNAVANWKGSKIEVLQEGVNGSKVLRVHDTFKSSNNIYRGSVLQKIPDLYAGKYMLSGEFKGTLSGLYLVVFYTKDPAGAKFTKWISADRFIKSKDEGWYKFSEALEVPADGKDGMIIIETWHQKEKGLYADLCNVKLIKQEDKK